MKTTSELLLILTNLTGTRFNLIQPVNCNPSIEDNEGNTLVINGMLYIWDNEDELQHLLAYTKTLRDITHSPQYREGYIEYTLLQKPNYHVNSNDQEAAKAA